MFKSYYCLLFSAVKMTEVDLDAVRRDLESFRSQLFKTDAEDDSTKEEIKGILDKYQGEHFQAFAEEYLITGFDLALVSTGNFFVELIALFLINIFIGAKFLDLSET